jgi:ribonuclease D
MPEVGFEHILDKQQLADFCRRAAGAEFLAFDTEFVSENRYRPQLCLLQVATPDALAIIDTLAIADIRPFWDLICNNVQTTIAHAAREEFLFCFREMGKRPKNLIDLQILAAFLGYEYPAAYGSLVQQILGKRLNKGETRTDWHLRPLSTKQIQYALQDVEFLQPLYANLWKQLNKLNRNSWYLEEIDTWQSRLEKIESEPQWQRLSGLAKLRPRELAIVRELFHWRDTVAQNRERSARKVLPDDLLLEIAKRGESPIQRLTAIRGLSQRVNAKLLPEISAVVDAANGLPDSQLPKKISACPSASIGILGQFLTTSLNLVCHEKKIAPGLIATAQEIRNLAAWKMGQPVDDAQPALLSGWRAPLVSELFDDVLSGRAVLRVTDPTSPNPVQLERWPEA